MVSTIDEIIERSRVGTIGVSFEDALKEAREFNYYLNIHIQDVHTIVIQGYGKFHYALIFISGIFMASTFFETMGINYVLPIAKCDLSITSKQQYGVISGIWYAGMC